jgi:hypothetical protein
LVANQNVATDFPLGVDFNSGSAVKTAMQMRVNGAYLPVDLPPGTGIRLDLGTRCFSNPPSYAFPSHGGRVPLD